MSIKERFLGMSLIKKFNLISFIILLICSAVLGRWVSTRIESQIVERVGHTTSLFAGSVIAPVVMQLTEGGEMAGAGSIEAILNTSLLGEELVALKIWNHQGQILYSSNPTEVGATFPLEAGLQAAWEGEVSVEISDLDRAEHDLQRRFSKRLLETYSPIVEPGTGRIVAVVEFYQSVAGIQRELQDVRTQTWAIAAGIVGLIYFSLVLLVRGGSRTIITQRDELVERVGEYKDVLRRNRELNQRLVSAAARTTTLNEQFLRRIAAELHDGPGQEIGYSLLILDRLPEEAKDTTVPIKAALDRALKDIRLISAGLQTPVLESYSVEKVVLRAARVHQGRTQSSVTVTTDARVAASTAAKITLYRVLQEALSNAYKHGGDKSPRVEVREMDKNIHLKVIDSGQGARDLQGEGPHLGMAIMRERIPKEGKTPVI